MLRILFVGLLTLPFSSAAVTAEEAENPHAIPADAKAILEKAERIELFALHPERPTDAPKDGFHGWTVLGKTTVEKADARKALTAAFEKGVTEYTDLGAKCFDPRHGIRATHDGKTADFLICFACAHTYVYVDKTPERKILVSRSPAAVFNKILKDAKVNVDEEKE